MDARTIEVSTPRLAKPIPAPYRDRARCRASCSCAVGVAVELPGFRAKREQGLGGTLAFVWCNRVRAAFINFTVKLGEPVDRRCLAMQRRLRRAVSMYVLKLFLGSLLISTGIRDEGVHHEISVTVCISDGTAKARATQVEAYTCPSAGRTL